MSRNEIEIAVEVKREGLVLIAAKAAQVPAIKPEPPLPEDRGAERLTVKGLTNHCGARNMVPSTQRSRT